MAQTLSTTSPDTLWTTTATFTKMVGLTSRVNITVRICAPNGSDIYLCRDTTCTDGAAVGTLPYARIPAGTADYFPLGSGDWFLAGSAAGVAGTTISVVPADA
ncbi:MAG TPA: hypothetical protein VI792_03230 [Candidatus Eisenbacteria bacterium]